MGHITKIVAVENATAIWEYNPTHEDNWVLSGSLDVIAAIQTLAIKVCVSIILRNSYLIELPLLSVLYTPLSFLADSNRLSPDPANSNGLSRQSIGLPTESVGLDQILLLV